MAKNATGTYVHVHTNDGATTTVVGPGEDFPKDYEPDKSLTESPDGDVNDEVPGPGQFRMSTSPVEADKAWKSWSVPELRAKLGEGNFEEGDRKDALISRAIQAGIDPASKSGS